MSAGQAAKRIPAAPVFDVIVRDALIRTDPGASPVRGDVLHDPAAGRLILRTRSDGDIPLSAELSYYGVFRDAPDEVLVPGWEGREGLPDSIATAGAATRIGKAVTLTISGRPFSVARMRVTPRLRQEATR